MAQFRLGARDLEHEVEVDVEKSVTERFWEGTNDKRLVEVTGAYIFSISDIDNVASTYKILIVFDLEWDVEGDDEKNFEGDPINYRPTTVPTFELPDSREFEISFDTQGDGGTYAIKLGKNFVRVTVKATVMQDMKLQNFPFDVQDLTFIVASTSLQKDRSCVFFVPPENDSPFLTYNTRFGSSPDFLMKRVLLEFTQRDNFWTELVFHLQFVRTPQGYMYRLAYAILLLTFTTLTVFSLDPVDN